MATSSSTLQWHPLLNSNPLRQNPIPNFRRRRLTGVRPSEFSVVAFRREDFGTFKKRVVSGEAWRNAWRTANDGFEQLVFDARKAAERLDRRYSISRRVETVVEIASIRARELDREFAVSQKWRSFSLDFSRNLPRYRRELNDFVDTPLGRSLLTVFFLWFALSGWLFRSLIIATWVLPIAGPLLLSAVASNLVVKGACPACKREFIGSKNSMVRCSGCGNIVWQPQSDVFSRGKKGTSGSKSEPEIIDVDFEEK